MREDTYRGPSRPRNHVVDAEMSLSAATALSWPRCLSSPRSCFVASRVAHQSIRTGRLSAVRPARQVGLIYGPTDARCVSQDSPRAIVHRASLHGLSLARIGIPGRRQASPRLVLPAAILGVNRGPRSLAIGRRGEVAGLEAGGPQFSTKFQGKRARPFWMSTQVATPLG